MKFAIFCLLALCVFEIINADKDIKEEQKKLDHLFHHDPRRNQLHDFLNKKGEKTDALLAAARRAKKNTVGCQQDYDDTMYEIYVEYCNKSSDCVVKGKKKNDYQVAVDCCEKLYKDAVAKSDHLIKDTKYCLDGL